MILDFILLNILKITIALLFSINKRTIKICGMKNVIFFRIKRKLYIAYKDFFLLFTKKNELKVAFSLQKLLYPIDALKSYSI